MEVIAGTRASWQKNHNEPSKDQLFYSLNKTVVSELGIALTKDYWKYFVRRSGSFRFPKANEETWVPIGIDALKLQTGVSYEMGGERKTEKQKSQINIYQLELLNEIAFDPTQTPDAPFGSYNNFPKTIRRGVTLTEYYQLTEKIALNGQFNVVNARFSAGDFSGNQIPAVPEINANAGLSYDFIPDWRVKYIALYNGSAYASKNNENKGSKIPSYWINTLSLQYIKKTYNINFEIINVLNQKYSVYTLYDPDNQTNTYYPGTGRSFLITCKIDLA
jgi:iron complex outermembrane receptor protein